MNYNFECPGGPIPCHACGGLILDRFIIRVNGYSWHAGCVKCNDCEKLLEEKCYSREDVLYCRKDYLRRFGPKCHGCDGKLMADHIVRRVLELIFHDSCLRCSTCSQKINTGDKVYRTEDSNILCEKDYQLYNSELVYKKEPQDRTYSTDVSDLNDSSHSSQLLENVSRLSFESSIPDFNFGEELENVNSKNESKVSSKNNNNTTKGSEKRPTKSDAAPHNIIDAENKMADKELTRETTTGVDFYEEGVEADETSASFDQVDDSSCRLESVDVVNSHSVGTGKKRGPRTTIKAKQLDMLKSAFIATPKPTRHIREQLAKDTGLSMRVIQVWFQNRRSKERRMKQVNMYSSRRHLYSRLPQRHLQNGFMQAPNVNILEPGINSLNLYRYNDQNMMQGGAHYHQLQTPYYSSNGLPADDDKMTSSDSVLSDANNSCHSNDTMMMTSFSDGTSPDCFSERSYLEELSFQGNQHNIPDNVLPSTDYFSQTNHLQHLQSHSEVTFSSHP